jgi:hypothetical protein
MSIQEKSMFFGTGISSYGTESPQDAYNEHLTNIALKRLQDTGKFSDEKIHIRDVYRNIKLIIDSIQSAIVQVNADNQDFINKFGVVMRNYPNE